MITFPSPKTAVVDILRVPDVKDTHSSGLGLPYWLIDAALLNGRGNFQFTTLNDWRASLCREAKRLGRPVVVSWRETKYGNQLLAVDWARQEATA